MTNKEIVKAWFSNIDNGHFEGLKSQMAPNHTFQNSMSPATANVEEHLGLIKMMTGALTGTHSLEQVISDGEWVAVAGSWSGKHTGDFNGVPASGKPVHFTWIDVLHIVNGKVADERMELNPMSIMTQISPSRN